MRLNLVEGITFSLIYFFNKFFMNYVKELLQLRNKSLSKAFPMIMSIVSMGLICKKIYIPIVYILIFLTYMVLFKIIFFDSIGVIYCVIINQMFHLMLFRDIVVGILSVISNKSMYQTVQCYETYILSFGISRLLMLLLMINFKRRSTLDMAKKLLINRRKLLMSNLLVVSLVIILLNSNYTYYYSGNIRTTTCIMLLERILIGFCFYFSLSMKIKSIKWVEEEVLYKTTLMNLEYNNNLNKKVDEYSNLLKMYNHDFKNILFNIKDLIEIGNTEKAKDIICEFDKKIESIKTYNKKFSNNPVINTLFNRLYEECKNENIIFDCDCYIASNLSITELDLINIFNNLCQNAFEACINQSENEKKWISFKSYVKDDNLIIYQSNSFNGNINFKNDRLITTKSNKKIHGIGVESIKYIVSGVNGMNIIDVDKEKREFKFLIKIPLSIKEKI